MVHDSPITPDYTLNLVPASSAWARNNEGASLEMDSDLNGREQGLHASHMLMAPFTKSKEHFYAEINVGRNYMYSSIAACVCGEVGGFLNPPVNNRTSDGGRSAKG